MVKKEEIFYDSRDNRTKLHAVSWTPKRGRIVGVLQLVHGMTEHIERYDEFATYMAERGFVVVGNDHLGHGESVNQEKGRGYFCAKDGITVLARDVHRLKKMIQMAYPGRPYFILGHSMGSFIVQKYMLDYGKGIDGAIIMGTGTTPEVLLQLGIMVTNILSKFRGDNYRSKLVHNCSFGAFNKNFNPARTSHDWLSTDEAKVDEYEQDEKSNFIFSLNAYRTLFQLIKYVQNKNNFTHARKDLPVFFVSGDKDPVGKDGTGVKKAYDKYLELGYTDVELKLYSGKRHELLNELEREQIFEDLETWIMKKVKQSLENN